MLNADPLLQRPKLLNTALVARALDSLKPQAGSPVEMWRMLTEHYVVDLDAVAKLLPPKEPETHWLPARE
ncbi:hypothetical protein SAMN05216360_106104 [Methylobacterium phyllostachyos]|uniref:Uncharacterized protein n=1 Tax=Methylobacterium phyllostachyos TaxID=582672 RepID=A0A1G9Z534_9HYPH|nr:hypothetical protein [Methylobacterium phyllostachyos]SDN16085.1 hypothetical protein SAMN05216360_106104 [Methylobacterium phyllostachyos]